MGGSPPSLFSRIGRAVALATIPLALLSRWATVDNLFGGVVQLLWGQENSDAKINQTVGVDCQGKGCRTFRIRNLCNSNDAIIAKSVIKGLQCPSQSPYLLVNRCSP